jgi:hypothetical protein
MAAAHRRFRNLIKTRGRTTLDEWSARRKGLYLHRTTQHRNTKTNIHASSGIRTHDPINQAAKTYALDRAVTGIVPFNLPTNILCVLLISLICSIYLEPSPLMSSL